jgi:uncharacterized membrane-anchored protein YhcB (DUF1043 family)
MNQQILLTIIEIGISLVVEGIILSMVFAYISNQSSEKQNQHLKEEMNNIETQNKFQYEQMLKVVEQAKTELISQIKESAYENKGGNNE